MNPSCAWCGGEIENKYGEVEDRSTYDLGFCGECLTEIKAVEEASSWLNARYGDSELLITD
jgi:hypothetical protein